MIEVSNEEDGLVVESPRSLWNEQLSLSKTLSVTIHMVVAPEEKGVADQAQAPKGPFSNSKPSVFENADWAAGVVFFF